MRVLIVEDEALIRAGIRRALESIGAEIEVVGECGNGPQAVEFLRGEPGVDLVLLDVQMPGMSGLEVVRRVGAERMPPVIFVTAHDEHAIPAFEVNAVDYLLKPFDQERLERSIERARERLRLLGMGTPAAVAAVPDDGQEEQSQPARFVVRNRERFQFVAADEIDWVESADNYVQLHTGEGATHLLAGTLTGMERKLDPKKFARVHRCHIVNLTRVVAVYPLLHGAWVLELRGGARVTTGRQYRGVVQGLIGS